MLQMVHSGAFCLRAQRQSVATDGCTWHWHVLCVGHDMSPAEMAGPVEGCLDVDTRGTE